MKNKTLIGRVFLKIAFAALFAAAPGLASAQVLNHIADTTRNVADSGNIEEIHTRAAVFDAVGDKGGNTTAVYGGGTGGEKLVSMNKTIVPTLAIKPVPVIKESSMEALNMEKGPLSIGGISLMTIAAVAGIALLAAAALGLIPMMGAIALPFALGLVQRRRIPDNYVERMEITSTGEAIIVTEEIAPENFGERLESLFMGDAAFRNKKRRAAREKLESDRLYYDL